MRRVKMIWVGMVILLALLAGTASAVEGIAALRARAEAGNAAAQYDLGRAYYEGRGVPQDRMEAAKWCRKAADQGHAAAQNSLGRMYAKGQGVPKDASQAAKWYRKAADQGYASAQNSLGEMYSVGQGVPKDTAQAAKWYRKAAAKFYDGAAEKAAALESKLLEAADGADAQLMDAFRASKKRGETKFKCARERCARLKGWNTIGKDYGRDKILKLKKMMDLCDATARSKCGFKGLFQDIPSPPVTLEYIDKVNLFGGDAALPWAVIEAGLEKWIFSGVQMRELHGPLPGDAAFRFSIIFDSANSATTIQLFTRDGYNRYYIDFTLAEGGQYRITNAYLSRAGRRVLDSQEFGDTNMSAERTYEVLNTTWRVSGLGGVDFAKVCLADPAKLEKLVLAPAPKTSSEPEKKPAK